MAFASMTDHTATHRPRLTRGMLVLALFAAILAAPAQAQEGSPWELLETLRNGLQEAGPMTAEFVQTYVPAGFKSGDEERGHLSIWLPDCLRWSYTEPAIKHFLVCQREVYFWNEDEPGGRRSKIRPEEEPGLDLLLVQVPTLRERYIAQSEKLEDGGYRITLAVPSEKDGRFSAEIRLDPSWKRVLELEYTDDEGNLTRFQLSNYQALRHTALFRPPEGIEWTEE